MDDTLTNNNYYSNCGARKNSSKDGCNFFGAYYPYDVLEKVKEKRMERTR